MNQLTAREVCEQLGISRKLLQKLAQREGLGELVNAPVPYRVFNEREVEAIAQRNRQPGRRKSIDRFSEAPSQR